MDNTVDNQTRINFPPNLISSVLATAGSATFVALNMKRKLFPSIKKKRNLIALI